MGRVPDGSSGRIAWMMVIGLMAMVGSPSLAVGHSGGHGGGRPHRAPAPQHAYRPPRMPHPAVARPKVTQPRPTATHAPNHNNRTKQPVAVAHRNAMANRSQAIPGNNRRNQTIANRPATNNQYLYGYGSGGRPYRAYGYGRGYRNRYYGAGYGYGRSQGLYRGIVSRLRSVHTSLARLDHDYQGHRVKAMRQIAQAIRQVSHGYYSGYSSTRFASGMSNPMFRMASQTGPRRSNLGNNRQPMSQAQSDARMNQALRQLQGIEMQLVNQNSGTLGGANASGHIQLAIQELNTALKIR